MTTLLPQKHQRALIIEYIARSLVLILGFVILGLVVHGVLLGIVRDVARSLNKEAHALFSETQESQALSLPEDPKRSARVSYLLGREQEPRYADVLARLASLNSSTVALLSISLEKKNGAYVATIGGTAKTRADLVALQKQVEENTYLANVVIPLESFTKDRNLSFTLSGTVSP